MTHGALFGLELQRARERSGLTLDQLAEATKISASLFAGLERGDLSRWPTGIFRRAFVRSYAQAVGLDPEETVGRFLRLYPDSEGTAVPAQQPPAVPAPDAPESAPRLVLDETAAPRSSAAWRIARRVGAPLVDLLLAGVPAGIAGFALGWQWFLIVAAGIGLVGHFLALALTGATPGSWLLLPRPAPVRLPLDDDAQARRREPETAAQSAPAPRRRQPRHASSSRPIPASRTRRVQH